MFLSGIQWIYPIVCPAAALTWKILEASQKGQPRAHDLGAVVVAVVVVVVAVVVLLLFLFLLFSQLLQHGHWMLCWLAILQHRPEAIRSQSCLRLRHVQPLSSLDTVI